MPLFVVSNREPYMHVMNGKDKGINVIVPASGLVTALEPVLLARNGTWVATGSGSADREMVDVPTIACACRPITQVINAAPRSG